MSHVRERVPRVPPRWFVRLAWYAHRALYRVTGGRVGLWRARPNRWGTLRLTTTGRRTHQERSVILGYLEDGPNLITMAMNGWANGEPAWWLNLLANPNATVVLADELHRSLEAIVEAKELDVKDAVHVRIVGGGRSGQVHLIDLHCSIIALCKGRRGHETAKGKTAG